MRTNIIIIIILIFFSCIYAFNADLEEAVESCESLMYSDTARNNFSLNNVYFCDAIHRIPYFYSKGNLDSIQLFLEEYKKKIGVNFDHPRAEIIFSIINGKWSSSQMLDYTNDFKYYEYNYKTKIFESKLDNYLEYHLMENDPLYPAYCKYNEFINSLADSLTHVLNPNSYQYLWALYYSKQYKLFFNDLKNNDSFSHTYLAEYYKEQCKKKKNEIVMKALFYSGLWQPNYNLNKYLGRQLDFGFGMGLKKSRLSADLIIFSFRAGKIDNKFFIYDDNDNSTKVVKSCANYYIGLDLGFELFRTTCNELDLLLGVGVDDIETATENISSLNLNTGIGYKIYIDKFKVFYIGPELKYHFINYEKDKNIITDLSGNAFTIRMIFGVNFFSSFNKSFYDTMYW
jgi:hypothetical protein